MSETTCLKMQLTHEDAERDLNFTERVCDVAGCSLKFYMTRDERLPIIETVTDRSTGRELFQRVLSEPTSGVIIQGPCKLEVDNWLQEPDD